MTKKPETIINDLISRYESLRDFSRTIQEDSSDVMRWRFGRSKVRPRAVIKICELHPEIQPHELNADIFPAHLTFKFGDKHE